MLEYKGYTGTVEYSAEDDVLHGEVVGIPDTITYEGETLIEIKQAFKDSVDDYLDFCQRKGLEPNKPYSGNLLLRTTPQLHGRIILAAQRQGKSANEFMEEVLDLATKESFRTVTIP